MAGPPPFEPPAELLSSLHDDVTESLKQYESSNDPEGTARALQRLAEASQQLSTAATSPTDRFFTVLFRPHECAAMRLGLDMGIYDALPTAPGEGSSVEELASRTGADVDLVLRITRVLGASQVLTETEDGKYAHAPLSRFLLNKSARAATKHLTNQMHRALSHFGPYFAEHGYKSPEDPKNAPVIRAFGVKDMDIFEYMERDPETMDTFNDAMAIANVMGAKEAAATYPFDTLNPGEDGVLLVDCGGGKGQTIVEIMSAYPKLPGKLVLQDLKAVIEAGSIVPDEVVKQSYNFFEAEQPIKGAGAYFFKWIFHDWPDQSCKRILRNLIPAMRGHAESKLLICDVVIPDRSPPLRKVIRDMNMMCIAGKERSANQWKHLLEEEGFEIEKIHGLDNANNSIIEARLKQ